ncbi:uroporphyrinogen-III synthase [Roseateles toxinivorans]|uniref:Uroporphyrinogen-III synthase n=1 Tax=Roseateles toxinivorans TaxID=270368 RepID=A0A4R6QP52_9BURK|nr:uroporphyrinogen-III synthase [Roseateles toxinivorans]TDP71712.1 uroporphyrinogen-III synthase [Roseateles toxinivorans]
MNPGLARLLVTRPAAQADEWVAGLKAEGLDAVALPLIAISAGSKQAALDQAWRDLALSRMLVFVSPNAVQQFFAHRPEGQVWPAQTLAATVGPGSARALREAGVPAELVREPAADAPSFDSEALWQVLSPLDWQGARVLLVRGDGGREWLGERLRERGAVVEAVQSYSRVLPVLDAGQQRLLDEALAAPLAHVWLLSSAEAIGNLAALAPPGADWSQARAVATHERIAEAAGAQGFGRVVLALPKLHEVAAAARALG